MKRDIIIAPGVNTSGLSEHDRAEIERLADYVRRVAAAKQAGVPHPEACAAIYPDVYPEDGAKQ